MDNPFLIDQDETFFKLLMEEDHLGVVIRSHLHIEDALMQIITTSFEHKGVLKSADLTYEIKAKLAVSLGLRTDVSGPLKCLGTLRNDFAHNLGKKLSKEQLDNFYNSFSSDDKNLLKQLYKDLSDTLFNIPKPKNHNQLDPQGRFSLYSIVLREILRLALLQQSKM